MNNIYELKFAVVFSFLVFFALSSDSNISVSMRLSLLPCYSSQNAHVQFFLHLLCSFALQNILCGLSGLRRRHSLRSDQAGSESLSCWRKVRMELEEGWMMYCEWSTWPWVGCAWRAW